MRVLIITSEWPSFIYPERVPFLVDEVKSLQKAGLSMEIFAFQGEKNLINYMKYWLAVRKKHNFDQFDLIHAHFGQSGLLSLPSRKPLVVTFHGSDLQGIVNLDGNYSFEGRILQFVSWFISQKAHQVIVSSEHLKKFLPKKLRVHVIPPGIDLDLFKPMPQKEVRCQLGLSLEKLLVIFLGNPKNPVKRYHLAEESVNILRKRMNVELIPLYGISHRKVPLFMNASDALILTSIHEGSPTVIKEALACNLPIVSVDVGDVYHRISNVSGCVLCAKDNPELIAEGLAKVLCSRTRIKGREAVADCDLKLTAEKITAVYRSALCH